jgi:hypothetical protein
MDVIHEYAVEISVKINIPSFIKTGSDILRLIGGIHRCRDKVMKQPRR